MDYVASMNALVGDPQFYNALTDNCTTAIRRHVKHINPDSTALPLVAPCQRLRRPAAANPTPNLSIETSVG